MAIPVSQFGLVAAASCALAALPVLMWIVQTVRFRRLQSAAFLNQQRELRSKLAESAKRKQQAAFQATTRWTGYRHFTVNRIQPETSSTTSVYLTPSDGKPLADFSPGQHLTMRFNIPGCKKPVVRCYSLSDSSDKPYYRISVKRVFAPADRGDLPPGKASNYVNEFLNAGQTVEAKAPSGEFFLDESSLRPLILLAGGIGITPMISIIEHLVAIRSKRMIVLMYGVSNSLDHPFRDRLQVIATNHPNLHVLNCYSQPQPDDIQGRDFQIPGRVSVSLLKKLLPSKSPNPNPDSIEPMASGNGGSQDWKPIDCDYYLCGPGPFMESIYHDLLKMNVDPRLVHFEAFGPASVNAIDKSSLNQAKHSSDLDADSIPETVKAEIRFVKSDIVTPWQGNRDETRMSLLETAEKLGVEVDSGCRAGNCGACAIRLMSGEVEYPSGAPADCPPGHCLICIAVPKPNSRIELEV